MKTFLLSFLMLILSMTVLAQENNSGTVNYEQVVKLEIKLEGDASQFANMLPKEQKSTKTLYFNPKYSLYENGKSVTDENLEMQSPGENVMVVMREPENKVFTDLNQKTQVEQREFMTRVFLIEGEVSSEWKITGNQKMILDFPCQEAILEKEDGNITAWFTPAIPVSAGPENYMGLPGLILAVESDEGDKTITATFVDFTDPDKDLLEKPKKGRKVSREEFDTIVKEKMEEMGAEQGGEGHEIIINIRQ